jgi:hypothetical protein
MADQVKTRMTQLRVRWDGDVPGVAEHRLSVAQFGKALELLLLSLRRIATQLATNAADAERPKGGRFANIARQLDIEVSNIEGNSTGFDGVISFNPAQGELPLLMDLADRATVELLDAIEMESKGISRNWAVRKYLHALPRGVHRQSYELHENGTTKKKVELGDIDLGEDAVELPSLVEVEGSVVGVGFDPGRREVRIKGDSGMFSLDATSDQVDLALKIRPTEVRILGVKTERRARILRINGVREPRFNVTPEAIEEHIYKRWAGVFARLSKA